VGNRRQALTKLRALHPDYLEALNNIYQGLVMVLGNTKRYPEAIALAALGQEAFTNSDGGSYSGMVRHFVGMRDGNSQPYRAVWVNPIVKIRSPKDGKVTRGLPVIRLVTWTGDFSHAQPSFSDSDLLVDGQSVKSQVQVESSFAKKRKLGPNHIWLKMRWSYVPAQRLAPGRHTVTAIVRVPGYVVNHMTGPGSTTVTWSFVVHPQGRDDDDDDGEFPCEHDD
jgi:hypothetical protein